MAEFQETLRELVWEGMQLEVRPLAVLLDVAGRARDEDRLMGSVADGLGIPRATVTRIAAMFVDNGLMTRQELPGDRRACVLAVTDRGRRLAEAIQAGGTGAAAIAMGEADNVG